MTAGVALPALSADAAEGGGAGVAVAPLATPLAMAQAPARDAALLAVQQQVGRYGGALVAWNPAGTLLADVDCTAPASTTLDVRDTASGVLLSSAPLALGQADLGCRGLDASGTMGAYPDAPLALQWSPQGDQVLVSDRAAGELLLWHVTQSAAPTAQGS